jgi:hypothetical protein
LLEAVASVPHGLIQLLQLHARETPDAIQAGAQVSDGAVGVAERQFGARQ